jgi:hypothetical protein
MKTFTIIIVSCLYLSCAGILSVQKLTEFNVTVRNNGTGIYDDAYTLSGKTGVVNSGDTLNVIGQKSLFYQVRTKKNSVGFVLKEDVYTSMDQRDALSQFEIFRKESDKFDPDNDKYVSSSIWIKESSFGSRGWSQFRIYYSIRDSNISYSIGAEYFSEDWMFIGEIKFLVDKDIFHYYSNLNPLREVRSFGTSSYVYEENRFVVGNDLFDAITNCKRISIRLMGEHYYQDRDLSMENIDYLKWVYKKSRESI